MNACLKRTLPWTLVAYLALCGAACTTTHEAPQGGTETGNPPIIDASLISLVVSQNEVHVRGAPGAATPGSQIEVTSTLTRAVFHGQAAGDGSFDIRVDTPITDTFEVRATQGGQNSSTVRVVGEGAAVASGVEGADGGTSSVCEYAGVTYNLGDRFMAEDGCNTCDCSELGVLCGEIACGAFLCIEGTRIHRVGESFPSCDGCNTCSCEADSQFVCTPEPCLDGSRIVCTTEPCLHRSGCSYAGKSYEEGSTFAALDGCNTCSCGPSNHVECTTEACSTQTCEFHEKRYQLGQTFRDELGCNDCSCTEQGVTCSERECDPAQACSIGGYRFASGTSVLCEDGCNDCTCNATRWTRSDRACPSLQKVERCCGDEIPGARASVLYIEGDRLALEVAMTSCPNHQRPFRLCFSGAFLENSQVTLTMVPVEIDACTAQTLQQKVFDLTPLRDAYRAAAQTTTGSLDLDLASDRVIYSF